MSKLSRRDFLKISGGGVAAGTAGLTGVGALAAEQPADPGRVTLPYPRQAVAKASALKENSPASFT